MKVEIANAYAAAQTYPNDTPFLAVRSAPDTSAVGAVYLCACTVSREVAVIRLDGKTLAPTSLHDRAAHYTQKVFADYFRVLRSDETVTLSND